MRWVAACLLVGCCAVSTSGWAAGVATLHTGDRTITVSFAGADARVDVSGTRGAYLLMRGDKVYSVTIVGGQPMVFDAQAAAGLLGGGLQTSPEMIQSLTRITPTGTHETVAGRRGEIYTVSYRDVQGQTRTGRGVLGTQPDVRELTRVLGRLAVLLQAAGHQPTQGTRQVLETLDQRGLGLLAYGKQFRLETLSASAPAPGSLDLPAQPSQLPGNLGQLLQGLAPQPQ